MLSRGFDSYAGNHRQQWRLVSNASMKKGGVACVAAALAIGCSSPLQRPSSNKTNAQQPVTAASDVKPEETDYVRLSTPVVKAWRTIPVGSPVCALDDVVREKDWLERSLIYRVDIQTGAWHILASDGYSVFMIYPYFPQRGAPQSVYQGIVLKVNGTLTEYDLRAAIRKRTPTVKIDSYDVFGANGVSVQRYSRPPFLGPF